MPRLFKEQSRIPQEFGYLFRAGAISEEKTW